LNISEELDRNCFKI